MGLDKSDTTVTLVGSFKKDSQKLEALFTAIRTEFTLLSPLSINFTSDEDGFVKTDVEAKQSIQDIERKHLDAIKNSDFVVLHAPSGYVGLSAAAEIGYAYALGIPILADEKPTDKTIETFVSGYIPREGKFTPSSGDPGKAIDALQQYYKRIAARRSWDDETPKDILLLILEEIGELARAVRKIEGIKRDGHYENDAVAEELADIQLYLVHLANSLKITLGDAVTQKETKNQERFLKRSQG